MKTIVAGVVLLCLAAQAHGSDRIAKLMRDVYYEPLMREVRELVSNSNKPTAGDKNLLANLEHVMRIQALTCGCTLNCETQSRQCDLMKTINTSAAVVVEYLVYSEKYGPEERQLMVEMNTKAMLTAIFALGEEMTGTAEEPEKK